MKRLLLLTVLAFSLGALATHAAPTVDDLAKFVAGLPARDAGLDALEGESWWASYAGELNRKWSRMDERQLAPVRSWAGGNSAVSGVSGTVYYMFSGPDFLYARTFFPRASTYILCGTEPIGSVPDITKMAPGNIASDLSNVRHALDTILTTHYFITKEMRVDLTRGYIGGTLPLLYVFLEKSGCFINAVNFSGPSVEIDFHSPSGKSQTLYYFKTDLSNGGGNGAFLAFCKRHGPGASLLKSASYLLHEEGFSAIRNFLLANSTLIIQDDSGIPFRDFDQRRWNVKLYGEFQRPNGMFGKFQQPDLESAIQKSPPGELGFSFGYAWQKERGFLMEATPR